MSVLNQSGEEQVECPLCMEPLEVDDLHFYPCTCGYQICRFCWNRIREGENGLCPACRKAYPENPADFTPLSQEQVAAMKTEKKAREQKRRNKTLESRKALANVRVVQNNLVFVVGLPVRLADPEILKRQEYFGKYGKIHKVVINQSTTYAGTQGPSASAYVTYLSGSDALRAIQGVNNVTLDGRVLKSSLGTTKYCANFMKNQPCPKPDCMYLHELGDPKASFTKEEMHAGLHQVYERKLHMQLLQREKPPSPSNGNAGTSNSEKSSSKEGNQSNFIPTTVVTSSHINVVNNTNSRSKKESISNGKEAWPSLGSSPPNDDAQFRKPHSPQNTVTSQENGTSSESSSPTEMDEQLPEPEIIEPTTQQERNNKDQTYKHKDTHNNAKKKQTEIQKKQTTNSIMNSDSVDMQEDALPLFDARQQHSYLADLEDYDSDRHSLLENHHDLLDNSLLEDDSSHNLLADPHNLLADSHNLLADSHKDIMQQRHRQMLSGLNDGHVNQIKSPMMNGYGLLERDMFPSDRMGAQLNQGLLEQKEILLRERSRSEMMMRNQMLARQQAAIMEPKHYMPTSSIGLDSANDLLGANYHPNHNMLPPFGMRVDSVQPNALTNNLGVNSLQTNNLSSLAANHMAPSPLQNHMGANSLANHNLVNYMNGPMGGSGMSNGMSPYMMQSQQMMQQNHSQMNHAGGMVNGFDGPQSASEGRYLAENMDKFFTDFHKAQQLRGSSAPALEERPRFPHNILSASSLEMHHKHRMGGSGSTNAGVGMGGARAGGDGDDDLDFDPFKETQKALAEMMETELMQKSVSSGDSMSGSRLPPPGFSVPRLPAARPALSHTGFNTGSAMYTDWTQMDPAIMSTSHKTAGALAQNVMGQGMGHSALAQAQAQLDHSSLTQQQHELIARFNHLGVALPINGTKMGGNTQMWGVGQSQHKLWSSGRVPLPPGFQAPAQRSAEAIDAN